jgi:DNA-binding transcriptional MocR family regulator
MSYKVNVSDITHDGRSLTGELVQRFVDAIEAGHLAPGAKLPATRELAEQAGVNPLTAARVYRRLAELGYVTASVGRGTFVRTLQPYASDSLDDDWQAAALPASLPTARERLLQDSMHLATREDVISLAMGYPAPETIPLDELARAAATTFAEAGTSAVSYQVIEGHPGLREEIGKLGRRQGFASGGEEILVTAGARQAIDLVARCVLRPGDVVCVESPSFVGTYDSLEATGARVIGIPVDADGIDVDFLQRVLLRHPVKLVALQSACQNPTGRHLSPERHRRLTDLARERSFFILEDIVYSRLAFDGKVPPSLRQDAPAHVITVDSVSKSLGGGLRVGWIAARGPVFNRLVALKMATDLHTSTLTQQIVARVLASGAHDRALDQSRALYARRAAALRDALDHHLPGEFDAYEPLGGHNLWLTLRRRIDERTLHNEALRRGVSFTPGHSALVEESQRASLRLCFSVGDEERLEEGVKRLAGAFRATLRGERLTASAPVA